MDRKIFVVTADITDEPNETVMTIVEMDGPICRFHGYGGFAAHDIYELLTKKETKNEDGNSK